MLAGGTLLPAGGAKGSGLASFIELLCAVLTGSGALGGTGLLSDLSRPAGTGHIFGCVDIKRFLPLKTFEALCEESLSRVTSLTPAQPGGEILLPGAPEERRAAESAANGVPVAPALRDTLNALAEELGCAARI